MSTDRDSQRLVGGLWCGEVLELLPDLVDGTLDPVELGRVRAHVAGCDWCERFGGRYGALVGALRRPAEDPDAAARRARLAERLARVIEPS